MGDPWTTISAGVAVMVLGAIVLKGLGLRSRQKLQQSQLHCPDCPFVGKGSLTNNVLNTENIAREVKQRLFKISETIKVTAEKVDNLDRLHAPDPATGVRGWLVRSSLYADTADIKKVVIQTQKERAKTNYLLERLIRAIEKRQDGG